MSVQFSLDASQSEKLIEILKKAENAGTIINEVFKEFGADEIMKNIQPLIHASGRSWKGKKQSATTGQPFKETLSDLSVTISAKPSYNYLYFPDDGSNSIKHAGNQEFMYRGAETSVDAIIEEIQKRIVKQFD